MDVGEPGPRMQRRDFAPGFMVRLQQKDLRLALAAAADAGAPLPLTALVHQLFARRRGAEATVRSERRPILTALEARTARGSALTRRTAVE